MIRIFPTIPRSLSLGCLKILQKVFSSTRVDLNGIDCSHLEIPKSVEFFTEADKIPEGMGIGDGEVEGRNWEPWKKMLARVLSTVYRAVSSTALGNPQVLLNMRITHVMHI